MEYSGLTLATDIPAEIEAGGHPTKKIPRGQWMFDQTLLMV
jgi:hypothetical protein